MLDVERLSNEKLRNRWKRIEKVVNKENVDGTIQNFKLQKRQRWTFCKTGKRVAAECTPLKQGIYKNNNLA